MREIKQPFTKKPVSPGSLRDIKILVVGNDEYFDGIVAYFGNQMGFSHKNLIYFLDCEKPGCSPEEINPDLVIVIKNRQDEKDEVTWPTSGVGFYDILLEENSSGSKQVWNYAFQNYSNRIFSWLWNFWNKYHSFLKTKPLLEVEYLCESAAGDNSAVNSECVKLAYHPVKEQLIVKKVKSLLRRTFRFLGHVPEWLQPATIRLMPHLKSFVHFYKAREAYGTLFNNNETLPFQEFEKYPFPVKIAA